MASWDNVGGNTPPQSNSELQIGNILPEEKTPFIQSKIDQLTRILNNTREARRVVDGSPLNEEQIYEGIGKALQKSAGGIGREKAPASGNPLPRSFSSPSSESSDRIKIIPVDKERTLEFRTSGGGSEIEIAATKSSPKKPYISPFRPDNPPDFKLESKDIGTLRINPKTGHVGFIRSSFEGAKEGVTDRLLMEAAKRGYFPESSILLSPGQKMVKKKIEEYNNTPKEKYLEKISNYLKTGKVGKLWTTIPIAGALLEPDIASAAVGEIIPGGVEEIGRGSDIPNTPESEFDPRYTDYLKRLRRK